jgi:hypothetical protein
VIPKKISLGDKTIKYLALIKKAQKLLDYKAKYSVEEQYPK